LKANKRAFNGVCCEKSSFLSSFNGLQRHLQTPRAHFALLVKRTPATHRGRNGARFAANIMRL
jgi:hypothetical protein